MTARSLIVACIAAGSGLAHAATVPVTNTNDNLAGSLRQAIANADPGDTVVFNIPTTDPGYTAATTTWTITLTSGALEIAKDVTIDGGGKRITVRRSAATNTPLFRIFNITAGDVVLSRLTITGGFLQSGIEGGGGVQNAGALTVEGCTISGNTGTYSGGGILNTGTLTLINSTVAGNVTNGSGGGIWNNGGALICRSSTIAANGGAGPNGGGIATSGTARVGNSIVAANQGSGFAPDVQGTFISEGYNFIGATDGSTGFGNSGSRDQTGSGTGAARADPMLGPLQDNGGPTATMSPLAGSKVIDQGHAAAVTTDQRDVRRPVDHTGIADVTGGNASDIGAVEVDVAQSGPNFVVTTAEERSDGLCGIGDCSLWDAANASNANTANNSAITFAPGVSGTIPVTLQNGGIFIIRPVSITGPGADKLAISGANVNRIFDVTASGAFSLSNLTLRDARWSNSDGAALRVPSAATTITGCRFINNATSDAWSGGAIYTLGELNISNTEFAGNKGGGGGGAVYPRFGSVVTISGCDFHDNEATNAGGGGLGGALLLWDGPTATISNSTFRNNKAGADGGAIYSLTNSTLHVTDSTFEGNAAGTGGRGGAVVNDGTATFTRVTFSGNSVPQGEGGAIYNTGTCNLTNATISGNSTGNEPTVPGAGGGIYNLAGNLTLTNVTLSGNARGGIHRQGGVVTLTNTLLAAGAAGANCSGFAGGTASLSDDASCAFGGERDDVDPALGPLADNGGTTLTHLPQPGSAAIDSGTASGAPATDQRGITRPQGAGFDVGAVERASSDDAPTPTPTPTPTATPTPAPNRFANISTRMRVETGDNVLIGGFIVTGSGEKRIIVRAIGPSLDVPGKLADPVLELYDANAQLLAENDNWEDAPNRQEIIDSTIPPSNPLESAILRNVDLGPHTAIVRGADDGQGVGLVEVYDLGSSQASKLANISTRGRVLAGDNVMIGGLIITGSSSQNLILRAIGPSLDVNGRLEDTFLELFDSNGTLLSSNNDWKETQQAEIEATTIPPTNELESAIVATLPPAAYTAVVSGANGSTGIALVEVYALD